MRNKNITSLACALALCCAGCSNKDFYDKEMYHPVLYMLSEGTQKVYTVVLPFNQTNPTAYFSVGCGGSMPNPEEVTIVMEPDTLLFDRFNRSNYDIDTAKYARLLSPDRYDIPSYTVTMPANSPDQYVKVPIRVNHQGLSPDSIYLVPLAIKSVSRYEVNPDKANMLFRVAVENDYAEQVALTLYLQRGTITTGATVTPVNASKIVNPLSADEIRVFAGNAVQSNATTLADIIKYAITLKINPDNTVTFTPYGTIEVEPLTTFANYNRYYIAIDLETEKKIQSFDLHYRYRTLTSANPVTWSAWSEVRETLQRSN
ncbi:MAG: DUF4361 domain-containing protein [Odoribacteraceae bacterium]|jgi:hypothetical protein|nr:DUF4361 domain-containing protein [Odoribacteraceae bacterium]